MQSLKQNLTQFTWNTLLYCLCNNKAKIWACCCCKAWIAWLCWAWICWFCIMSWLCCHSRASLSLFCSCKSSDLNSRSCSSFFRRKPTTSYVNLQLCFYSQCHLSLTFSCFSKSFHCFFFLFLEFCFFRFRYQTVFFEYLLRFYVHFLQISLLGLQEVVTFDFSPVFDLYLFMKVVKWSLRPRTVTANSSQMFNIGYIPYLRIYFHLYPCSPLLSS